MRALLDTNVLFDIIARRMDFEDSLKLFIPQIFGDMELWVSAKSYTDIFYVLKEQADAQDIQKAFLKSFQTFQICAVDQTALTRAAELSWPDFEDCLISVCAEKIEADAIITRDAKGFGLSSIKAYSPTEIFEQLKSQGLYYDRVSLD